MKITFLGSGGGSGLSEEDVNKVLDTVSDILNNVKLNKDDAIREYTEKFDGVTIENLKVSKDEIEGSVCKDRYAGLG